MLARGVDRVGETRDVLESSLTVLGAQDVPSRALAKVSHRVSYGIVESALEEQCNLVVLGRARRVSFVERLAATVVDRVVRSGPSQVVEVSADHWPDEIHTVLVALERGPHSELTLDLARAFATQVGADLRAVHVVSPDEAEAAAMQARTELEEALGDSRAELRFTESADVIGGILREARGADVIFIGGTEAGILEHVLGYALPLELADRTKKPVVIVYEMPAEPKRWLGVENA